ncbi:3-deoxy-manno-octulosonate cytidylyltransferase [Desulfonema magnum]|uniref:3-deoxy-manno-octulosonate cytidylyltransferase n=1 Tax=Desulfonema magnum TaxID=45655 RepID=A0A975BV75_9BACT|nr:3-deoxy-manno-octulosonate cytidylyltransferase [Desulfonema magnum]QTA92376.1 3-deoxy-manno-octulosonate cytidylyltransferase [Desulfonema magnum]
MKIVVIIPSRYGSTRFEGKPLALISGKPMIQRVYERAKQAACVTDVVIATDDSRIFDAVTKFSGNVVMTSAENRSGTDRVGEVAEKMGLGPDDIVVNVQGDQPLLDPRCLDEVVAPLKLGIQNSEFAMSTLAFKIENPDEIAHSKNVKVTFDNRGVALYFSRSPIPYGRDASLRFDTYKHLGVYAYTKRFLEIFRELPEGRLEAIEKLEQLRALENGHKIMVVVTSYDSPEVDLPEDIARVEKLKLEI